MAVLFRDQFGRYGGQSPLPGFQRPWRALRDLLLILVATLLMKRLRPLEWYASHPFIQLSPPRWGHLRWFDTAGFSAFSILLCLGRPEHSGLFGAWRSMLTWMRCFHLFLPAGHNDNTPSLIGAG